MEQCEERTLLENLEDGSSKNGVGEGGGECSVCDGWGKPGGPAGEDAVADSHFVGKEGLDSGPATLRP